MVQRAVAGRGDVVLARVGLGQRDQLLDVVGGKARVRRQHVAGVGQRGDGFEILHRVEPAALVQPGVDDLRAVGLHQQRVAVGLGLGNVGRAHVAAGAWPVVDDDRLPQLLRQLLPQHAGNRVVGAAGRLRHDDGDWLGRKALLRVGAPRGGAGQQQHAQVAAV